MSHFEPDTREMPPAPMLDMPLDYQKVKDTCDLLTRTTDQTERSLNLCGETTGGVLVDLEFDCHIRKPDPRDRRMNVVLAPTTEMLAISDPKAARSAVSQALATLGDLMWAAWQERHPESGG